LSREEAEVLLSYLTVDYVRIPLVVGFFASHDRVTYLFNVELRNLLRAVLFESGTWIPENEKENSISHVPVRRTALQQKEFIKNQFMYANSPKDVKILGTSTGLLLNEMYHSPEATLKPLFQMFNSIKDLSDASVYSADATFILYLISLAIDTETYLVFAIDDLKRKFQENKEKDYVGA